MNLEQIYTFTKNNSKSIVYLSEKNYIIKLPEEKIGENLFDLVFGNMFLGKIPKVQSMKKK